MDIQDVQRETGYSRRQVMYIRSGGRNPSRERLGIVLSCAARFARGKLDEMARPPVEDDSDAVRLYAAFLCEQDAIEEYQRERARIERNRKRDFNAAIRDIVGRRGIAPGSGDTVAEWNEAVPKTWKRWGGIPADIVVAGLASAVPWLGIHSEDDLYQALYTMP